MPELRTDDGPRRLRAVWLGPKGATLPFEWTYVQWLVLLLIAGVASAVFMTAGWLLTHDLGLAIAAGVLWGWPAGAYLGVRVMRGVSADESVRAKWESVRAQLGRREHDRLPADEQWLIEFPSIRPTAALTPALTSALTSAAGPQATDGSKIDRK